MIELTKLNGSKLVINSDLIEFIESSPDSLITLTTGKKIMVQEAIPLIINAVVQFRRLVRSSESGARASLHLETSQLKAERE
jgi:flagellar protein FlbD